MMKFAVIGAGAIARRGHLPSLKEIRDVEVLAIVDTNENAAKRAAKKFNIKNYYKNIDPVLKDEEIEAVIIASPTPTHKDVAIKAAQAGKHLVIEKPLAASLSDGLKIKKAIKKSNIRATVVQNYRYYPSIIKARKIIRSGQLGGLTSVYGIAHTPFPNQWTRGTWLYYEPGVLLDFTPHVVDAILWISKSKPKRVFAIGGDYTSFCKFINYAQISIDFHEKIVGTIDASWLTGMFRFVMSFIGTSGRLEIDPRYNTLFRVSGIPTPLDDIRQFMTRMRVIPDILSGRFFRVTKMVYDSFYRHLMSAFQQKKRMPVPIDEALETLAVLDGAYKSIKTGDSIEVKV